MGELLGVGDVRGALAAPPGPSKRTVALVLGGVALAGMVVGAVSFVRYARRAAPDMRRVAVAPFDVFQPGLETWRVSLALALSAALDRDDSLDAVPQETVAQRWRARTTPLVAAIELARQTGAGLAIYGRVEPGARDSVRVRAAVLDAVRAMGLFEVEVEVPITDPAAAADSLSARILRRLP